ncbi:hypothetical protein G4B88_015815 [Cannabis sativa]|uniref:Oxidoreductase-like domain-containing protein n=1 Tax=Cannabis sativa TaxID=3483 RepID=A0A7J6G1K7_CANSA|nr:hypothetical protein G4B88_015815 [Cannabis sativa]
MRIRMCIIISSLFFFFSNNHNLALHLGWEEPPATGSEKPPPPPPPEKPLPGDCCGSGCVRCLWDIYYDELEDYNKLYKTDSKPSSCASEDKDVKPLQDMLLEEPELTRLGRWILGLAADIFTYHCVCYMG